MGDVYQEIPPDSFFAEQEENQVVGEPGARDGDFSVRHPNRRNNHHRRGRPGKYVGPLTSVDFSRG